MISLGLAPILCELTILLLLVFDTEEENKLTYTDVYKNYQTTVSCNMMTICYIK